jgi:hypothetical protein
MPAFPPPCGRPARAILHGHGAGETRHLTGRDIGSHPDTADRQTRRHVVDDHDRLNPGARTQKGDQYRAQPVGRPAGARLIHHDHLPDVPDRGEWPRHSATLPRPAAGIKGHWSLDLL